MASRQKTHRKIEDTARKELGLESLHGFQKDAVTAVLEGHDTLVVQPTGSGKSAIYQVAGLLIDGSTVVVSPLIALQKDQVDAIIEQDTADAAVVNSLASVSEVRERLERVKEGGIEYIFLAPEQFRKPATLDALREAGISLFVIDEAHCISEWGHDFRPDYLRLGDIIEQLGHPRVLALTATASPPVRQEIVQRLRMRNAKTLVGSFDRPNIYLRVDHFRSEPEKRETLIHRIRWAERPGIVYVATRKDAAQIMETLQSEGIEARFYHGGLGRKEREDIHEAFMSGDAEVIVATSAFGMGVDKPDIRFVYHYAAPESLDAYYQEIGRAGRDGERSEAVLFYRQQDIGAQSFKTGEGKIEPEVLEQLAARVPEEDPEAVGEELGLSKKKLTVALQHLEDVAIEDPAEAARAVAEEQERRRLGKRERLEEMRAYANAATCRREILLRHLGDGFTGPCGACDNCDAAAHVPAKASAAGTRREVV